MSENDTSIPKLQSYEIVKSGHFTDINQGFTSERMTVNTSELYAVVHRLEETDAMIDDMSRGHAAANRNFLLREEQHMRDMANMSNALKTIFGIAGALELRHDFTHAEIRGVIKLILKIAEQHSIENVGDIPF